MKHFRIKDVFLGALFAAVVMVGMPMPAQAAVVSTEQLLQAEQRNVTVSEVQAWLAKDEVRQKLEALGVNPEQARERVGALTDQELQQLALNMDQQPAGGGLLAVVGIVFVVLLVLEVLGITNVFNRV